MVNREGTAFWGRRWRQILHSSCQGCGLADVAPGFFQGGTGSGAGNASSQHNQRDWRTISGGGKTTAGSFAIGSGDAFENADGALSKLLISREDVDHEVAVDVSQASHGPCGQHIENHFVGRAGFHARGAGENLRTDFGDDGEVRYSLEL